MRARGCSRNRSPRRFIVAAWSVGSVVQQSPQGLKGRKCNERNVRNPELRANDAIEHPAWKFQPAIQCFIITAASENSTARLLDDLVDTSKTAKPRMRLIKNLAFFGPVGVPTSHSTTANGRTRALTPGPRTKPTSTNSRWWRPHEIRRRCWGVTPVGLRPPCVLPQQRQTGPSTGRDST